LNSKFQEAIKQMQQKRDTAIKKVSAIVEAEAKLRTPVLTGTLKRSITHQTESNENESRGRVGTNVQYAVWVEKGSTTTPAQPFLVPAIEENIDQLREVVRKELGV
jgi:HK97 gp10 family phage protein